jgi:hypothetical protein
MTRIYFAPLDRIDTFVYPNIVGLGTITHLGDIDGLRYFHVDDGVPLPQSDAATFEPAELTGDLTEKLVAVAPTAALPLLVTDGERGGA